VEGAMTTMPPGQRLLKQITRTFLATLGVEESGIAAKLIYENFFEGYRPSEHFTGLPANEQATRLHY
jgi:hypothetical protein